MQFKNIRNCQWIVGKNNNKDFCERKFGKSTKIAKAKNTSIPDPHQKNK